MFHHQGVMMSDTGILKRFYANHKIGGKKFSAQEEGLLNSLQQAHIDGELDLYEPIEAYAEEWEHVTDKYGRFIKAFPKPDTRSRKDLPTVAQQWKEDYRRRFSNG